MPLTYEIVFKSQGDGGQPTKFGVSDASHGIQPVTEKPQVPTQPEKPPAPSSSSGNLTPKQVEELVARASEKAKVETPPIPAQTTKPSGEVTLDAIRDAAKRSADDARREDRARILVDARSRPETKASEPPVRQPQPAPSVGSPSSDDVMKRVNDESRRRGEESAKVASSMPDNKSGSDDGEFYWPGDEPQPQRQERPMPRAGEFSADQVQGIIGKIVGAAGIPGAGAIGSLAGAAGPAAVVGGGLGLGAALLNERLNAIKSTERFSPEVTIAQNMAEIAEMERQIEQARKYGEDDAEIVKEWERLKRTGRAFREQLSRSAFYWDPITAIRAAVGEAQLEYNRKEPTSTPFAKFLSQFGNIPDPEGFNAIGVIQVPETPMDVITGI